MDSRQRESGVSLIELLITTAILSIVLGIVAQVLAMAQRDYVSQRELVRAQDNGLVALDNLVRLIRMAGNDPESVTFQAIDPDPDGNGQLDSIQIRSDWNPADGALDDRYENVTFTTSDGSLFVQEPNDANPIEFLENISSVAFAYFDSDSASIANPIASSDLIALVQIVLQTEVTGRDPVAHTSSVSIRSQE